MAQITNPITPASTALARRISTAWIVGGLAWTVAGLLHADTGWRFDAAAGLWLVADLLLFCGLLGLFTLRPHGTSRVGTAALVVALVGRAAFAAGEIVSVIEGNDEGPLIPLGAVLSAVALTAYGVTVLRRTGPGDGRWSYLVMGLYPFVAMFPALAITGEPSALLIAGWGVPAVLVGAATRLPADRR
jgi:hypothetical protein